MMDKAAYERSRGASKGLFQNALVLPVAIAISHLSEDGETFGISELSEALGGRAAAGPIRKATERIVSAGAARQLASLGPPHPDAWERCPHPLWTFARDWEDHLTVDLQPLKPE